MFDDGSVFVIPTCIPENRIYLPDCALLLVSVDSPHQWLLQIIHPY